MPELPEVETVRIGLTPAFLGARVVRLEARRPNLRFPMPEGFAERIEGRRCRVLARRAKYLLADFEDAGTLIMHLGMSGRFTVAGGGKPGVFAHETSLAPVHDHVVFHFESGACVTYNDPRRFGFMLLVPTDDLDSHPLLRELGPEPLGNAFHASGLAARATGRTTDLKAFLMDQRVVAGLGNIYVCEALHRAGLSPRRAASSLARADGTPSPRAERLVGAVRDTLRDAIAAGGSSLRDYRQADGAMGYFQHTFTVYGRAGGPCARPACSGTVQRIVQAGRSTFFCGRCQR
ncbi:MAG: bifunctional DNA-formamidopyrimidine glycosylase/DNA-(apurinic or apyrimidinic site) lyase [Hyphomicrobiaceae bacterium]|nr:bifunctional DNA-formamidopyrimidine glycosylase/DNA-(apurinic or apyrimidinic site) lyase [Hyphomicrobiaceae bacterium]